MTNKVKETPEMKVQRLEKDIANIREKEERLLHQRTLLEQKLYRIKLQKEGSQK